MEIKLVKLRRLYIASMPDRHAEITTCWVLAQQQHWCGEAIEKLRLVIRGLANSGVVYGFPDISAAACAVEQGLKQSLNGENTLDIHRTLQALCSLLTMHSRDDTAGNPGQLVQPTSPIGVNKKILLLDTPNNQAQSLAQSLQETGCEVALINTLVKLKNYVTHECPSVILYDAPATTKELTELQVMADFLNGYFPIVPRVFISDKSDFVARLQAVKMGATDYITKPITTSHLLAFLDEVLMDNNQESYRVLIVTDDVVTARAYQAVLEHASMQVLLIDEPELTIASIIEFKPDIILMDMTLPDCQGFDLATLIRQEDAYLHIPILFLVSAAIPHKNLSAIGIGGDDYLTKPIVALDHLVRLTSTRIQYTRKFNRLIANDGLTGFLNCSTFLNRLGANIAAAERAGSPIAIAILDIDNFKVINQNYGYWMGNKVLKQVAKFLRQRLRRGDLLGRYHGDGFIIALNDADIKSAERILNHLIRDIANVAYHLGQAEFHITLSVGIAHYPGHIYVGDEVEMNIVNTAEKALQTAKAQGRNQVVIESLVSQY